MLCSLIRCHREGLALDMDYHGLSTVSQIIISKINVLIRTINIDSNFVTPCSRGSRVGWRILGWQGCFDDPLIIRYGRAVRRPIPYSADKAYNTHPS